MSPAGLMLGFLQSRWHRACLAPLERAWAMELLRSGWSSVGCECGKGHKESGSSQKIPQAPRTTLLGFFKILICIILFIYFFGCVGFHCCTGLFLVLVRGGHSLVVGHGLLIGVSSLAAEHRLQGIRASVLAGPGLESTGSVVVANQLTCSAACGIRLDQG